MFDFLNDFIPDSIEELLDNEWLQKGGKYLASSYAEKNKAKDGYSALSESSALERGTSSLPRSSIEARNAGQKLSEDPFQVEAQWTERLSQWAKIKRATEVNG